MAVAELESSDEGSHEQRESDRTMSEQKEEILVEKREDGYYDVARFTGVRAFARVTYTRAELEQLVARATKILEQEK